MIVIAFQYDIQLLRYIQDLLGHESSKTTEIYKLITHKGWDKIKSPIDDLKI